MKTTTIPSPAIPASTEAEIRERAYYLWLERGCPSNRDQEMWYAAQILLHDRACRRPEQIAHAPGSRDDATGLHLHATLLLQDARPGVARSGAPQRQRSRSAQNRKPRS